MAQPPAPSSTSPHPTSSAGNALSPKESRPSSLHNSPVVSHRSSFAENLRNYPPSPRAHRTPSFSGQALTDLLMHPPIKSNGDESRFKGRDWRDIQVSEIVDPAETRFVELDTSIEDTTKLLIKSGAPNVVLIRESRKTRTPIGTFDYSDLNAYLLLVLGLSQPDELAARLAERARSGHTIPLRDVNDHLGPREEPAFLPHTANLIQAMEVLGGGAHRVVICKDGTSEAIGVLSQLRLVRFFWENHQNFSATEQLYAKSIKDLELGAKEVLAINGDKPVADALRLMHSQGITSLPVLDSHRNVCGNISHVDVRLLTDTSAIPLLSSSCLHFIGVILSERGSKSQPRKSSIIKHHLTFFICSVGRPRLVSRLSRNTFQHLGAHRSQAMRYSLAPHVDRRRSLSIDQRATQPGHSQHACTLQHAAPYLPATGAGSTSRHAR